MSSRAARLAELRALRAAGKTRLDSYQVEEEKQLYEEVDEEGYKKVVRSRLDQDDFVVDDNGEGYADDGREDWDTERLPQYDSESDEGQPLRGKAAKRKREEDREKKEKAKNGINKYFSAQAASAAPKPKPVKTAEDEAFLADLLGEVDANVPSRPRMKPVKSETRRKTRVLSPPLEDAKPKSRQTDDPGVMADTPPAASALDEDNYIPQMEDDVMMSDPPLPSSPVTKAVERKFSQVNVKAEEEEDDDLMEVEQAVGHSGIRTAGVNMTGSRPAPKIKKQDSYPTPDSSSPVRPPPDSSVNPESWINATSKLNIVSSPAVDNTPAIGKLKPECAVEEDGSLNFFWLDYTEVNGSLCLFGKVKDKTTGNFVSCFVKVDNILRKLYFLPREYRQRHGRDTGEEVGMGEVYEEVDALMSRFRVNMHKIKPCTRKYAFELPDIPKEAEYLKLLYPYDKPALPTDLKGETFSHVFGTTTALFEQFVLWKNIMGPCWLKIDGANFTALKNASWCKLEALVERPVGITPLGETDNLEAPPLTVMSIALRTTFNAKDNKQEILMASARIYENISLTDTTPADKLPSKMFTIMRPNGDSYPTGFKLEAEKHVGTIKMERNEQSLLSMFMAILGKMDPDVLMGHRLEDVDYSILLNRLREKKTPGWHRIGRLRRSDWPKNMGKGSGSFFAERQIAAGRLLCDLANDLGKSLMTKCQSWSLNEMCELVLGEGKVRQDIDNETALKTWATKREGLMNYVRHCEADTFFIAAIALKVQMLPLTKVLTNLAGNSWGRTLSGTRAERNEYILLHEFHRNKYICPDKVFGKGNKKFSEETAEGEEGADAKKKDKYKGGLVFEPEKGLYDRFILVMDFNSLYPSIIQEFNICFTTVERSEISEEDEKVPEVPAASQEQGILPRLIATLVNRRREVKKLMKAPSASKDQLATWDIKQMALKLTANSMYGCLGYTRSRFYARPLAMLTTFKGREILRRTKDLAEEKMLRVIYGDTDSVMINTNMDNMQDAFKVGNEFKRDVNDSYKLLEIDIDNVFRRLLLHAKKKYAAINMIQVDGKWTEKLEVKGLDMRRREYCALSKETSSKLLNFLLSGEDPETVVEKIHEYLRELAANMRDFKIPAQKYTIFTQLGKDPKEYPNANSMPSVQVALRQMAKGKHVKAKDVMSFIITGESGGSAETAAKNAYTLEDVLKSDSGLKPDIDYYLHKQILPPVERLCAPIAGTNVTRLAECLGLDTSKYRVSTVSANSQDVEIHPLESQIPDEVRFKDSLPLHLRCPSCKHQSPFRGLAKTPEMVSHDGLVCTNASCGRVISTLSVASQLEAQLRQHTARYYAGWLVCDDPACGARTRQMSVYGHRCLGPQGRGLGCAGRMNYEFGDKAMYNQLLYLQSLFDADKAKSAIKKERGMGKGVTGEIEEKVTVLADINRERFETWRDVVKSYLDRNGRQWVQMDSLFAFALKATASS
ncbi:DNA-directed DNA polymerase family B pol2 [Neofusicoccum parvum]|uniref:DNA-directed DNA polymerase family B pol2 n=1 Tax=Neofusicoccum parvum TaxID=310453 RepID=A0ACB5RYX2_9PEZI|nr:DNA-directed DNA polymerase family B pol2 [Neofusicoccum parvum]GME64031.1 DNA-directed DNA polymerase family B pol2 [Neofusicoccum parvum]